MVSLIEEIYVMYSIKIKVHDKILKDKKVAVLLETEYIAYKIEYYINFFSKYEAEVYLLTYLFWEKAVY